MAQLDDNLQQIKKENREQLIDRRNQLLIDRAKIESKLDEAEVKEGKGESIDEEWFRRTNFAYKATGILMQAIDNELAFRKDKDRKKAKAYSKLMTYLEDRAYNPEDSISVATILTCLIVED